ncbi:MAG: hypothetical protein Q9216_005610 [Gyalolechia sp. 2 TL-2023]
MKVGRRKAVLFGSAAVLRVLLYFAFPHLPSLLTGRAEISTPVTSFKRLQEGLFLYTHNVSPYDGGVFYQASTHTAMNLWIIADLALQAPIFLPLFALIPPPIFHLTTVLLYIAVDLVCAEALSRIAQSGVACSSRLFTSPRKDSKWDSLAVGAGVFSNCAILVSIASAVDRKPAKSMLALALAAYFSLYPVLLLPPMVLLCYDQSRETKSSLTGTASKLSAFFFGSLSWLLAMSYMLTGHSWEFLRSTYGVHLLLPDLTPNVGLWWYFFIEMFDSFREFFLVMRYTFFAIATVLYATLLGPAFYHLWIYAGSGNANFFYAITLVWSLGLSMVVGECLFAVLRDEWEVERPEMKGKDVRRI